MQPQNLFLPIPPDLSARFRAAVDAQGLTAASCVVEAIEAWLIYRQIGSRLANTQDKLQEKPKNEYHTVPEIRAIIIKHAESLQKELGEKFHLNVFRHHVRKHLILKDGDENIVGSRNMTRIDSQIANAISSWPNTLPLIVKADKREWYKFNQPVQNALDLN